MWSQPCYTVSPSPRLCCHQGFVLQALPSHCSNPSTAVGLWNTNSSALFLVGGEALSCLSDEDWGPRVPTRPPSVSCSVSALAWAPHPPCLVVPEDLHCRLHQQLPGPWLWVGLADSLEGGEPAGWGGHLSTAAVLPPLHPGLCDWRRNTWARGRVASCLGLPRTARGFALGVPYPRKPPSSRQTGTTGYPR